MNQQDCKHLARLNLKANRGTMMKIQIFLIISTVMVILFTAVMNFLQGSFAEITESYKSARYLDYIAATEEEAKSFREFAKMQEEVGSVSIAAVSVMEPPNLEIDTVDQVMLSVENCYFAIDGKQSDGVTQPVEGTVLAEQDIGYVPIYLKSFVYDEPSSFQMISDCELEEYRDMTGREDVLVAGSAFSGKKQIILSEYMLTCFGYPSETHSDLIGKDITLGILYEGEQYICLENYTLQGILKNDYFHLSVMGAMVPQMWIVYDENETMLSHRNSIGGIVTKGFYVTAYLNDFEDISVMLDKCEKAGYPMELGTVQMIALWLNDGMLLLNKIVLFLMLFFVCIMLVSICNSMYFYYSSKKDNYNMLMRIGAKAESVQTICKYELFVVFVRSYSIAAVISLIVLLLVSHISKQYFELEIVLTLNDYLCAYLLAGILLGILFVSLYLLFPKQILRHADTERS